MIISTCQVSPSGDPNNFTPSSQSSISKSHGETQEIQPFSERFYQECIEGSGIAPDLYRANVQIVEDSGKWEPNQELGHHVSMFWQTTQPHSYGALAGFYQETGELWQGKPENPAPDKKKTTRNFKAKLKREISKREYFELLKSCPELIEWRKYEYPLGAPVKPFLPPVDESTRQAIANRNGCYVPNEGSFWDWLEQHPDVPLIITEGGKKSLSLLSQGYVAIALVGVNGAVKKYDKKINGEKVRKLKPELCPILTRFAANGREITLAFDQDTAEKTVSNVEKALDDLSFHLTQAGAKVRIASWDGQNGRCKGIDDLIVAEGIQAWEEAYQQAASADLWRIRRSIRDRVKRKPDLNIGDQPFWKAFDQIPKTGILGLVGPKGSEKSTLIKKILEILQKPWISYSPLQSLARDQAASWGGIFVNDGDRHQGTLLNRDGEPVLGGSACWPSALGVAAIEAKILILDETTPSLQFLHSSKLANKDGIRPFLEAELIRRIQQADLVILADADMTEETLRYIESIRGERAFLVRSERKPLNWVGTFLDGTLNQAKADVCDAIRSVPKDKVILLHTDSRAIAEEISALLEREGIKTMPITQKTSGGELEREFLQSKGKTLPMLIQMGIRAIICSPSVTIGFSVEHETDYIHQVWGILTGCSIAVEIAAQSLDRGRCLVDRFIWAANRGKAYSQISKEFTTQGVLRDIRTNSSATLKLVQHSLRPATLETAEAIDYGRENLKLLASFEAQRNRGMRSFKLTLQALLEAEGKTVKFAPCRNSRDRGAIVAKALKELRKAEEIERQIRIENGIDITPQQAEALEAKKPEDLSQSERDSLDKFYLSQFYRVDSVARDLVSWDKQGKRRTQIRTLERILNPEKAAETTVQSIEQNPDSPQDWNKSALQVWLLNKTGGGDFIRKIYNGELTEMTEENCSEMVKQLQSHHIEFEKAFGVKAIHKQATMQAVSWLLQSVGIEWNTKQRRVHGERVRVRIINQENLTKLKAVIQRRFELVTPPAINEENQGGVTAQIAYSPNDLADLWDLWQAATSHDERGAVLDAAIALGIPATPNLWRAVA